MGPHLYCINCKGTGHNVNECTESKQEEMEKKETVNHPSHYGGADNPYEVIKVIEAWNFPSDIAFHLGNTIKYISRAGKKGNQLEDLRKSLWYLNRAISIVEKRAL